MFVIDYFSIQIIFPRNLKEIVIAQSFALLQSKFANPFERMKKMTLASLAKHPLRYYWLAFGGVFLIVFVLFFTQATKCPYTQFGSPDPHNTPGACYCLRTHPDCPCTASLAIDAILEYNPNPADTDCLECQIAMVFRRDPPRGMYAIPGGFVKVGETTEQAVVREVKEETQLTVKEMEQFRFYAKPGRDSRRHTASMVYRIQVPTLAGMHGGDDARQVKAIFLKNIFKLNLAFDHKTILYDYIHQYHPKLAAQIDLTADSTHEHEHERHGHLH